MATSRSIAASKATFNAFLNGPRRNFGTLFTMDARNLEMVARLGVVQTVECCSHGGCCWLWHVQLHLFDDLHPSLTPRHHHLCVNSKIHASVNCSSGRGSWTRVTGQLTLPGAQIVWFENPHGPERWLRERSIVCIIAD